MKRILLALLSIMMVLTLCGCSLIYDAYDRVLPDKLTRGVTEDGVYTSAYAGFVFTAPEGWVFATDEQLASMMDLSMDAMAKAGLEFSEEAIKKQILIDMMATNTSVGSSVALQYENLALSGNTGMSLQKYLDMTKDQLTKADLMAYAFHDAIETTLCGETYQMMQADLTDYGSSQYYYVRKLDKYMLCLIITAFGSDDIESILDCFSEYAPEPT